MPSTYVGAIIGYGAIAGGPAEISYPMTHTAAYRELSDRVTLVAIADPSSEAAQHSGSQTSSLRHYDSVKSLLAEETPDILSICTPPGATARILAEAQRAGVQGIWCEKPLTQDTNELETLRDLTLPAIQVNTWRAFVPEIADMASQVSDGAFGAVHHATAYYAGALSNNGTHMLALAQACLGPIRLLHSEHPTSPESPLVIARTESGVSLVCVPIPRRHYNIFELDILCENARVRFVENGRHIEVQHDSIDSAFPHLRILAPSPEITPCCWQDSFVRGLENLLDHLDDPATPLLAPIGPALNDADLAITATALSELSAVPGQAS